MDETLFPTDLLYDDRLQSLEPAAYRIFFTAMQWSNINGTDGFIDDRALAVMPGPRATDRELDELVWTGLFVKMLGGYEMPDYLRTREVTAARDALDRRRATDRRVKAKKRSKVSHPVFERDGWACRKCGAVTDLTVDHVWPRARGGANEESNYQTLCRSCNSRKGVRVPGDG